MEDIAAPHEQPSKAHEELVKKWGSPQFLTALVVCHTIFLRKTLEEFFPGPSTGLIVFLSIVAVVNFFIKVVSFRHIRDAPRAKVSSEWPDALKDKTLSIIFPAYNEGDTIDSIVRSALASSSNKNIEVIVVNDRSKDNTWEVLKHIDDDLKDPRYRPIQGKDRGKVAWKGKNWSVAQGYEAAKGDYLLFCDADVTLKPQAIETMLTTLVDLEPGVGWISFVPKTTFSCLSEYIFNWPGTMIAQALIPRSVNTGKKTYAFGQCNLFERKTYERLGGHRGIGHFVAESHALATKAQEMSIPMRCYLAFEHVELVWYFSFNECWNGQLKSIRGRLLKPLPVINRALPRSLVAAAMSIFVVWQTLPWLLLLLQVAKVINGLSGWGWPDSLLTLACGASVLSSYLNRLLGFVYLGYDMCFWWISPWASSWMLMLMAIRACRPDAGGRWGDGEVPEGFSLPKDVPPSNTNTS
mmetsp:Transcript_20243/g.44205  ORF Transcript_20243/g.44205 Transcript_20243/m.44205 type:complete len:467 (+) Transcript_20243:107-1507(+)